MDALPLPALGRALRSAALPRSRLQRHFFAGITSASAVALVTAAIFGLRHVIPVLSLGVLYLFAVLAVALAWGLAYAVLVAVASMLAFNWFFLPPVHTFR